MRGWSDQFVLGLPYEIVRNFCAFVEVPKIIIGDAIAAAKRETEEG